MGPSEPSDDDRGKLPDWALRALEAVDARPSASTVWDELRREPGWPLLLDAAVVSTFLPRDLAPDAIGDSQRADAEKLVLRYSEVATTSAGSAWELTRDARTAVLGSAIRRGELQAAVDRTEARFRDMVSVALRDTLTRQPTVETEAGLGELEARRAATALVSSVEGWTPPVALAALDRDIRQRRLIEPFERMCGVDYEARIVGRTQELEALRAYVGTIAAPSLAANVTRGLGHLRRAITGRRPYVLWGTGGVGKTTLISRFMLEHIRAAERNFPFAYLDFDRPSVSARDPFGLLSEICLQVSAQFEELDAPLRALRETVHARQPRERSADADVLEVLGPLVRDFRGHIDSFLDSQESFFEWSRPLLLVFDTFEVAQYDSNQVGLLERFVRKFNEPEWSRLRLIVSGRRRLENFNGAVELWELEGIDLEGACSLLARSASEAGKPISQGHAQTLAELLAVKRSRSDPRVHPLRARMVGDIFRTDASSSGDAMAESLIAELRSGRSGESGALRTMIDGILVRRIIGHVADERVRALADPGLVVRRITPKVIRSVMARGTPRLGTRDQADSLTVEPWRISEAEASDIYAAFAKELTLVDSESGALRHRQDVRNEMLPLIRAASPRRFELLHRLAFRHFRAEAAQDDPAAAAEAIYHGLWCGRPIDQLDALWTRARVTNARIDPEEFESGSLPAIYLKSRNREALTLEEVRYLPRRVAAQWAVGFGDQFLLSVRPADEVAIVRAATGPSFEALRAEPRASAIVARLLYRTGRWRDARMLIERATPGATRKSDAQSRGAQESFVRLRATLVAKAGAPLVDLPDRTERLAVRDVVAMAEVLSNTLIAHARHGTDSNEPLHDILTKTAGSIAAGRWASARRVLRLVVIASAEPDPALVAAWVSLCERLPRDRDLASLFHTLFARVKPRVAIERDIARISSSSTSSRSAEGSYDILDVEWRRHKGHLAQLLIKDRALHADVRRLAAYVHDDWHTVLESAMARGFDRSLVKEHGYAETGAGHPGEIVRAAAAGGRFLELARLLADAPSLPELYGAEAIFTEPARTFDDHAYPQSAAHIARALAGWHEALLSMATREQGLSPT